MAKSDFIFTVNANDSHLPVVDITKYKPSAQV